ncbi:MAG: cytochrome D1 domain-containing protein [Thiohalomonadaceae bacterium]
MSRAFFLVLLLSGLSTHVQAVNVAALYSKHCVQCHGDERLGGIGPALLPQNLSRLRKAEAMDVIAHGRPATQMEGFGKVLAEQDINALAEFIYTEPESEPRWGIDEITSSQLQHNNANDLPNTPVYKAGMQNLFLVVELGDHHITLLDGDNFEPVHRFPTRYALHGGPKYSPDGRFVYLCSRDGWVSKYDLYNLKLISEVRAGINARNLAVSADGRYVMVANYLPHSLVLLDADSLQPIRLWETVGKDGTSSRVSAVYTAPPRQSFIASLKDTPEVWEINYADQPPPGFGAMVHDFHKEQSDEQVQQFPLRRLATEGYLDDFFFDHEYEHLIAASRDGGGQVIDLYIGRKIANLELPGMPHLGSGITFKYKDTEVLATPNLKENAVSFIDTKTWQTIKRVDTLGPGFFMRSHEGSPYAWVDVFFGPNKDVMHVIDKSTLEIVQNLRPEPGKTSAHVEFTNDGRYALVSIWDMDGALVIYDANTLKEIKRLPMKKPSGKYNVYNKTTYGRGTSH